MGTGRGCGLHGRRPRSDFKHRSKHRSKMCQNLVGQLRLGRSASMSKTSTRNFRKILQKFGRKTFSSRSLYGRRLRSDFKHRSKHRSKMCQNIVGQDLAGRLRCRKRRPEIFENFCKNLAEKLFRLVLCTAGASDRISNIDQNIEVRCVKTLWDKTWQVDFDVENVEPKFSKIFAKI